MVDPDLRARVEAWVADDPDPETRGELRELLDRDDASALADRFAGPLRFGTAGLRGVLGAGPARMNRLVVARATAGLLEALRQLVPGAAERGIVVGYDGRRGSAAFAREVRNLAAGAGFHVHAYSEPLPTPLVGFACQRLGAAAGVMVTASHNPPEYNGYKVFWEDAAQIVPPVDAAIARHIDEVGPYASLPKLDDHGAEARGLLHWLGTETLEAYLSGVADPLVRPERSAPLTVAYTALHGVGQRLALPAMEAAAQVSVHPVAEQAEPDGTFPTVRFPNPEEPGAMDLVVGLAERTGADLAIANDPDADRLAVVTRDANGTLRALRGDDVGVLLAEHLLSRRGGPDALVVNTLVSAPLLGDVAAEFGARWERTLTGFKWIEHRALQLERTEGLRLVLGYEEALGYAVGTLVRDKDGIGAAALIVERAAELKAQGRTLHCALHDIWRRHGVVVGRQRSVRRDGPEGQRWIRAAVDRLFSSRPEQLAGRAVEAVMDLRAGVRRTRQGTEQPTPWPKTSLVVFELSGGHAVMARPSGTEPKLKFYAHARVPVEPGGPVEPAQARAEALAEALLDALEALAQG